MVQDEYVRGVFTCAVDDFRCRDHTRSCGDAWSTLDVGPTLADIAGLDLSAIADWTDGESLVQIAAGAARKDYVAIEYAAEASR